MNPFNWTQVVFIKLVNKLLKIVYYLKYKLLKIYCFKFDVHVAIHNFLYYMKFIRVSATPYSNYSLLCILLLKVFCSTIWNLVLGILYYVELRTWYYMVLYLWNFVLYFSNSYSLLHIRYLLLYQL